MVNPDASVTGPAAMPAPEWVIDARDIVTRFGKQVVHNGLDLQIRRGDLVAMIGGSGTGKSVLLREIIGLHRPDSGSVNLLGTDVWTASPDMLAAVRRRFGMMFQEGALFSSLTAAGAFFAARGPARRTGSTSTRTGRPAARCCRQDAKPAVGRHGQARGDCARDCPRTRSAVPG
jgi:ABC-type sugar transport system ATPase subunit